MDSTALQTELRQMIIEHRTPHDRVVARLRELKDAGVSQEEMHAQLESLRPSAVNEEQEDEILEIMDYVSGFCSTHMKVF